MNQSIKINKNFNLKFKLNCPRLSIILFIYISFHISLHLSINLSIYLSINLSLQLSIYLSTWDSPHQLPASGCLWWPLHGSWCCSQLSMYLTFYLSFYLSIYLRQSSSTASIWLLVVTSTWQLVLFSAISLMIPQLNDSLVWSLGVFLVLQVSL